MAFVRLAGLGPAIHEKQLVDPRAKPGDDGEEDRQINPDKSPPDSPRQPESRLDRCLWAGFRDTIQGNECFDQLGKRLQRQHRQSFGGCGAVRILMRLEEDRGNADRGCGAR